MSAAKMVNVFEMYKQREVLQVPMFDWIYSVVRENRDAIEDIDPLAESQLRHFRVYLETKKKAV